MATVAVNLGMWWTLLLCAPVRSGWTWAPDRPPVVSGRSPLGASPVRVRGQGRGLRVREGAPGGDTGFFRFPGGFEVGKLTRCCLKHAQRRAAHILGWNQITFTSPYRLAGLSESGVCIWCGRTVILHGTFVQCMTHSFERRRCRRSWLKKGNTTTPYPLPLLQVSARSRRPSRRRAAAKIRF